MNLFRGVYKSKSTNSIQDKTGIINVVLELNWAQRREYLSTSCGTNAQILNISIREWRMDSFTLRSLYANGKNPVLFR
jgi:hypothetical protein